MLLFAAIMQLVLIMMGIYVPNISCECRKTYVTTCDTFDDLKNYTDTENLSELVIGSDYEETNMTSVHLMRALKLENYYKLTTLTVIRAINHLEMTYGFQCSYTNSPLLYFTLYGNDLKIIEAYHFPVLQLKKLSLINNQIESIKSGAFTYHKIENIDLSDNLLEVVERASLPSTNATKIITIKNNKLTHVESGSLPSSLESLNLDKNKLRYLQEAVLEELVNLKELTLSHNSFNDIPNIKHLKELVIIDMSFNKIKNVKAMFGDMANLKLLDLSNNNIKDKFILKWLHVPGKQPGLTVSLALNRLRNLNLTNAPLEKKKFVLYGNPWDCNFWPQLRKQLSEHESECDLKLFSDGSVPYCIDYGSKDYVNVSLLEHDIDSFHETIRSSEEKAGCVLAPGRYQWLYHVNTVCVA